MAFTFEFVFIFTTIYYY